MTYGLAGRRVLLTVYRTSECFSAAMSFRSFGRAEGIKAESNVWSAIAGLAGFSTATIRTIADAFMIHLLVPNVSAGFVSLSFCVR
jgi:hypothetical protein